MSARHLTPRAIRRALDLLLQLPAEALEDLAERIVERLDAAELDPDLEEDNEDGCTAEDVTPRRIGTLAAHIGDEDDAEEDNQDSCAASDDDPAAFLGHHGPGDADDSEEDDPQGWAHGEISEDEALFGSATHRTGTLTPIRCGVLGRPVSVSTLFREARR